MAIKDTDKGLREIVRAIGAMDGARIELGWRGEQATIAAAHEFGRGVPMRAMMAPTFDEKGDQIVASFAESFARAKSKSDLERAAGLMAETAKAALKDTITTGRPEWPPLSAATIARKGSSKPLIDTGEMLNSVDYRIKGL